MDRVGLDRPARGHMQAAKAESPVQAVDQVGVDERGDDLDADDPSSRARASSRLTVGRLTPIRWAISCCEADCS